MIFGTANDFSIEAICESYLIAPSAVWGRMCIRSGNLTLGEISDEHCGLYGAYCHLKDIVESKNPLWDDSFRGLNHQQIHDLVHDALYGDDKRSMEEIRLDSKRYHRFDFLTNWGEMFDGFSAVIFQSTEDTITILRRDESAVSKKNCPNSLKTVSCSLNGFREACAGFIKWFDNEVERLSLQEAE